MSPDQRISRPENSNLSVLDSESEDEDEEEEEEGGNERGEVDDGGGGGEDVSSDDEEGDRCPICLLRLRLQPVGRPQPCQHLFCLVLLKLRCWWLVSDDHSFPSGVHHGVGEGNAELSN